jgi:hypothetical protein
MTSDSLFYQNNIKLALKNIYDLVWTLYLSEL